MNDVLRDMQRTVAEKGVEICKNTCRTHVKIALENNRVAVFPQKPSGAAMSSFLEKQIAKLVRALREKKFPASLEEILKWAAEAIEGTEYEKYFERGKPTRGWYKDWLNRMEFTIEVLRPFEQTRHEWYTPTNLATYFEMARDTLLDAGVAIRTPISTRRFPIPRKS